MTKEEALLLHRNDQIWMDNHFAMEMGISYGKYMALVESGAIKRKKYSKSSADHETVTKIKPKKEFEARACLYCGGVFYPKAINQHCCCPSHTYLYRLEGLHKDYPDRKCKNCGKIFKPRTKAHYYCSPECRVEDYKQMELASKTDESDKSWRLH